MKTVKMEVMKNKPKQYVNYRLLEDGEKVTSENFLVPAGVAKLVYDNGWLVKSATGKRGWMVGYIDPRHSDGECWFDYTGPLGWAMKCAEQGRAAKYEEKQ